jgi:hypothetical protein
VWYRAPRDLRLQPDLSETQYTLENLLNTAPLAAQAMLLRYADTGSEQTLQLLLCDYGVSHAPWRLCCDQQ